MESRARAVTTADLSGTTADQYGEDDSELRERDEPQEAGHEPLLPAEDGQAFQSRWQDIQVRFVDEPQGAVKEADGLVAELMQRLAGSFAEERGRLETEWERGAEVSTEDLRQALQHYRSFFNRLLSA
jgi:hypothetical protein